MNTIEISQEERDLWRFEAADECGSPSEEDVRILRLLKALVASEAEVKAADRLNTAVKGTRWSKEAGYMHCLLTKEDARLFLGLKTIDATEKNVAAPSCWAAIESFPDIMPSCAQDMCPKNKGLSFVG